MKNQVTEYAHLWGRVYKNVALGMQSDKPTVECVILMYLDRLGKYAAVMVVDTPTGQKYVLIEDNEKKFHPMKRAQEMAEMIGVSFIDETKDERSN